MLSAQYYYFQFGTVSLFFGKEALADQHWCGIYGVLVPIQMLSQCIRDLLHFVLCSLCAYLPYAATCEQRECSKLTSPLLTLEQVLRLTYSRGISAKYSMTRCFPITAGHCTSIRMSDTILIILIKARTSSSFRNYGLTVFPSVCLLLF
jgi:hypothetical protein